MVLTYLCFNNYPSLPLMSGRYSFVFYNFDRLTTIDIEPAHHLLDTVSHLPDTVPEYRSTTNLTCGGDSYHLTTTWTTISATPQSV